MAPKRQRSSPLPSGHPSKRRAQDPLEESKLPIKTLKNPPRQRLEGLGLPPPLNAPARKPLPKKAPPPLAPQEKQQAPPNSTSSSSLSIPSDQRSDEEEEEEEEEAGTSHQHQQELQESQLPVSKTDLTSFSACFPPTTPNNLSEHLLLTIPSRFPFSQQYPRVKTIRLANIPRYRPLIPTTLDPFAYSANKHKNALTAFGATFLTAEQAASAADRALIAMWGFKSAEPLLHFPQPGYYKVEDRQQRFGHHLSSFLNNTICKEALEIKKKALAEKERLWNQASTSEQQRKRKKIRRIRDASALINEMDECGLCSSCRQPWLGAACERKQKARQMGYNSLKIAEKMLEDGADIEEEREDGNGEEEEREDQERAGGDSAAATTGSAGTASKPIISDLKHKLQPKKELNWLENPPKGKPVTIARWYHSTDVESLHKNNEAMLTAENSTEVAALNTALEASRTPGLATAFPPRDFIMQPPQIAMLRHAVDCAAAGVDLALVEEDDPRWARPVNPGGALQCSLCYGWHGTMSFKDCPLNQAANALEPPEKEPCRGCKGGRTGCSRCGRGDLPAAVWAPETVPCTWVDKVNPATLDVMHSVQSMASAAAVDFDRPDVAEKLGPEALLALGLLVEEVAAAQVTAKTSTSL